MPIARSNVDGYNEYEVLSSFEVYMTDALRPPFATLWGAADLAQTKRATVLGVAGTVAHEGVRLRVCPADGDEYEQLWAEDADRANAVVLDDHCACVADGGGLPLGAYGELVITHYFPLIPPHTSASRRMLSRRAGYRSRYTA